MVTEQQISEATSISREDLRAFREKNGKQKGWFSMEENGSITWHKKAIEILEANTDMDRGEIVDQVKTLEALQAVEAKVVTATVLKLCVNRSILLGRIDDHTEVIRIRVPTHRLIRVGHRLLVSKLSEGLYKYMGRVKV